MKITNKQNQADYPADFISPSWRYQDFDRGDQHGSYLLFYTSLPPAKNPWHVHPPHLNDPTLHLAPYSLPAGKKLSEAIINTISPTRYPFKRSMSCSRAAIIGGRVSIATDSIASTPVHGKGSRRTSSSAWTWPVGMVIESCGPSEFDGGRSGDPEGGARWNCYTVDQVMQPRD